MHHRRQRKKCCRQVYPGCNGCKSWTRINDPIQVVASTFISHSAMILCVSPSGFTADRRLTLFCLIFLLYWLFFFSINFSFLFFSFFFFCFFFFSCVVSARLASMKRDDGARISVVLRSSTASDPRSDSCFSFRRSSRDDDQQLSSEVTNSSSNLNNGRRKRGGGRGGRRIVIQSSPVLTDNKASDGGCRVNCLAMC